MRLAAARARPAARSERHAQLPLRALRPQMRPKTRANAQALHLAVRYADDFLARRGMSRRKQKNFDSQFF